MIPGDSSQLPAQDGKNRMSDAWTPRDLPAEIWTLVAQYCFARDLPNLAAACTMLYDVARRRARQDALAAYSSVDAFVSLWQEATAFCDRHLHRALCDRCRQGTPDRRLIFLVCVSLCVHAIPLFEDARWRTKITKAQCLFFFSSIICKNV